MDNINSPNAYSLKYDGFYRYTYLFSNYFVSLFILLILDPSISSFKFVIICAIAFKKLVPCYIS